MSERLPENVSPVLVQFTARLHSLHGVHSIVQEFQKTYAHTYIQIYDFLLLFVYLLS